MPPLSTYRLNWARRTSWGWWDDWNDTVLQTQDSKFEPWRSKAEHATSRSREPLYQPQYWLSHVDGEETFFVSLKPPRPGTKLRTLAWKAAVLTTTLGPRPLGQENLRWIWWHCPTDIMIYMIWLRGHIGFLRLDREENKDDKVRWESHTLSLTWQLHQAQHIKDELGL